MEILEPKPPGTLWETPGLLRNSRTFTFYLKFANLLGSSSGRQLYMQFGMFYIHRCEQYGGWDSLELSLLSTILLTLMHVKHTILHILVQLSV